MPARGESPRQADPGAANANVPRGADGGIEDRTILLHIGFGETGTSALQSYLSFNPEHELPGANGRIRYCAIAGDGRLLQADALRSLASLSPHRRVASEPEVCRLQSLTELRQALGSVLREGFVPLLSQEDWGRRAEEFRQAGFLRELGCEAEIIVYVRPQVEWFNAGWWQWWAWDPQFRDPLDVVSAWGPNFMYWADQICAWRDLPGVRKVTVRLHRPDAVSDFFSIWGANPTRDRRNIPAPEISMAPLLLKILRSAPETATAHQGEAAVVLSRHLKLQGELPWAIDATLASRIVAWTRDDNRRLLGLLDDTSRQEMENDPRWWSADHHKSTRAWSGSDSGLSEPEVVEALEQLTSAVIRLDAQLTEQASVLTKAQHAPTPQLNHARGTVEISENRDTREVRRDAAPRYVAFYLPQFHPIPENDEWWGTGFTEWTNVASARPSFAGHYQPHLPADLGFYDLRLAEARAAQAELASRYGIHGFCYWHYWFGGRRLLERPFNEVLASGAPELPFCLAWANETWSRRWLGEETNVLIEQTYSAEDDREHARWLLPALADPRCIRIGGRSLFLIYRPSHLPSPRQTTDTIREVCASAGLPDPYLLGIDGHCRGTDCTTLGFDGTVRFEPQLGALPGAFNDGRSWDRLRRNLRLGTLSGSSRLYDYDEARALMNELAYGHRYYPTVFVGWDNTPRRAENAIVITGSTPERLERALRNASGIVGNAAPDERIVFINAWNEWAEGNHLEPDLRNGRAMLEAVARSRSRG
jgi:hypothetical protein